MKFQPDTPDGGNVITRQDAGCIWVGNTSYKHSVVVPWQGDVMPWPVAVLADLTEAHFEQLASLRPEVVIFGSGPQLRFGVETMDTAAACRTYNVLASEGRLVLAALLVGPAA
jgi:uncharacterized protein